MKDKQKIACAKAKINSLKDEIAGLMGKCEALDKDKENLTRTLEECNEEIENLKAEKNILLAEFEEVKRRLDEYQAGKAVILTAERYAELEKIEIDGVISSYELRKKVRKETAKEILDGMMKNLHKLTGCGVPYHVRAFINDFAKDFGVEVEE